MSFFLSRAELWRNTENDLSWVLNVAEGLNIFIVSYVSESGSRKLASQPINSESPNVASPFLKGIHIDHKQSEKRGR